MHLGQSTLLPEGEIDLEFDAFWVPRYIRLHVVDIHLEVDFFTEDIHTIALILTCIAECCNKGHSVKIFARKTGLRIS